ncbi:hypothetical protein REPUB_Repub09cG0025500 [Reevesia pubescens]
MMSERVAIVIAETIGDVLEVDTHGEQLTLRKFLRAKVNINVSKTLRRGCKLAVLGGDYTLVMLRYERLPDFCYVCGRLNHHETECDVAFQMKKCGGMVIRDYGPWLNADYKVGEAMIIIFYMHNLIPLIGPFL